MKKKSTTHLHIFDAPSCFIVAEVRLASGIAVIEVKSYGDRNKPKTFSEDSKKMKDWFSDLMDTYRTEGRKVLWHQND